MTASEVWLGSIVEMPERTVDLIFRMLRQNEGKLSKRAQDKEFAKLAPAEIAAIERLYAESFGVT